MVASTITKLPIPTWFKIMGIHPVHAMQVELEHNPHCGQVYFQYPWQTADHASREDIAQCIADAEAKIEAALGYHIAPTWDKDEWRPTTSPFRREFVNLNGGDVRGFRQVVQANWGHFITGGMEAKSLIDDDVTIVYTDEDNDGYDETATVTIATSVLDKNEVGVFYPGHDGDDAWEIRPTNVVITSGVATITFRRELAVLEEILEAVMPDPDTNEYLSANALDDDDFLEKVDVYRRYNDPQLQAIFLWEPMAGGLCGTCNGEGCSACAYATQTGCLTLRGDPRNSLAGYWPGSWNNTTGEFDIEPWAVSRQPDIIRLYYYSGWRNKRNSFITRMDPDWERAVAYLAAAQLERPPCDCAKGDWSKWRQDFALIGGDEDGKPYYRFSKEIWNNPFGTRRGEVEAWRKVRPLMRADGVLL